MSTAQFKLSQPDGFTRRVSFPVKPAWHVLASKIESLYSIPLNNVGVSYVDSDNDTITVDSDEELQDFYRTLQASEIIRLTVLDLTAARAGSKSPFTNTTGQNTFGPVGEDAPFDFVDDWQRLPRSGGGLSDIFVTRTPGFAESHAFVEVVESDVSGEFHNHNEASDTDNDTVQPGLTPLVDKGKAKADMISDVESCASVLDAESSPKHPIHVLNVGSFSQGNSEERASSVPSHVILDTVTPVIAESTPKARAEGGLEPAFPEDAENSLPTRAQAEDNADMDPPLPSFDNTSAPNVTLSNDVAAFLTSLSDTIVAHPELRERFQQILRNASNGTYWAVHRESLSRAVADIVQSTSEAAIAARRRAEEEAGMRVADAMGRMVRTFSDMSAGNIQGGFAGVNAGLQNHSTAGAWFGGYRGNPWMRGRSFGPGRHSWGPFWDHHGPRQHPGSPGPPPPGPGAPPIPPSFQTFNPPAGPPPSQRYSFPNVPPPPPPPPPPGPFPFDYRPVNHNFAGKPSPSVRPKSPTMSNIERSYPPVPAVIDTLPTSIAVSIPDAHESPGAPPTRDPLPASPGPLNHSHDAAAPPGLPSRPRSFGVRQFDPYRPWLPPVNPNETTQSPQDLRAQVEAAKLRYKEQKARYREEREQRKRERERKVTRVDTDIGSQKTQQPSSSVPAASGSNANPIVTQVVSNARGPYPQFEMYSVPRRHNTHSGHGPTRERTYDDLASRTLARVTKRLSDMGFTENVYPDLPAKIKAKMPKSGAITKDGEDDLVTTLLEEMLAMSPKPRVASGFGQREAEVPGAWR